MKKNVFFILLFAIVASAKAQTMYVDADATGNNDGSNWANAFTNLDTALANYDPIIWGGDIWVAEGTYKPGDGSNRAAFFTAKGHMYGGFNGTETALNQRDWKTNLTILSGDLQGNDAGVVNFANPTRSDNSYSVVRTSYNGLLNGFVIEGGHANGSGDVQETGAAIYNYNNGMTISNCVFRNNYGDSDGAVVKFRGPSTYNSWFTFYNNEFYNNSSPNSLLSSTRPNTFTHTCYMRIFNNLFHHNTITSSKGSIIMASNYSLGNNVMGRYHYYIYNNTFVNNTLPSDGADIAHGRSDNANNLSWGRLTIEIVGNIFGDNQPLVWASMATNISISNKMWFISNVIKGTNTIALADLHSDDPYIGGNIYDEYPMFEDTTNNDYQILACASPGNDIVFYTSTQIPHGHFQTDFYGNPRDVGVSRDAGHCEVQQTPNTNISAQQVGNTIEATSGFSVYTWYFVNNNVPTLLSFNTSTITPTNGDRRYVVIAKDTDSCGAIAQIDFCSSVTVSVTMHGDSLIATGAGGNVFQWYFNDTNVGSGTIYAPTQYGEYEVRHYFFDGGAIQGCTGYAFYNYCGEIPNLSILQNETTLEASVTDANNYQWYLDGTAINGATSSSISVNNSIDGDYYLVIDENGCMGTSNTISYCGSIPNPPSIGTSGDSLVAPGGYDTYQWQLNGTAISGATTMFYEPTQNGDYTVTVGYNSGCQSTSAPYSFTQSVGINDMMFKGLSIYPNPSKNILYIEVQEKLDAIQLIDLNGKIIKTFDATNRKLDISNIAKGIYFIKINNHSKQSIQKIIVQ